MHHCVARPVEGCWCSSAASQRSGLEGSMVGDAPALCEAASSLHSTIGDSTCSPSIPELEQVPQLSRLSPATPHCAPPVTPRRPYRRISCHVDVRRALLVCIGIGIQPARQGGESASNGWWDDSVGTPATKHRASFEGGLALENRFHPCGSTHIDERTSTPPTMQLAQGPPPRHRGPRTKVL